MRKAFNGEEQLAICEIFKLEEEPLLAVCNLDHTPCVDTGYHPATHVMWKQSLWLSGHGCTPVV
jgi:hypothetical protein